MTIARRLAQTTLSNQNISAALLVATYTADSDRKIYVQVRADQVAGGADYYCYLAHQLLGSGSFYEMQPRTKSTVATGVTAVEFISIPFHVKNTDVIKAYIIGAGGDIANPDLICDIWEDDELFPTTPGQGGVDVTSGGEVALDFSNIKQATAPTTLADITIPTVTTLTNANPSTQDVRDAMKLAPTALPAPAVGSVDTHLDDILSGIGGIVIPAALTQQQVRDAMKLAPTAGAPAAGSVDDHLDLATLEATLTAMKGAGWTTESLIAIYNLIAIIAPTGMTLYSYPVTDSITTLPIADVAVEVSTDAAHLNVIRRGRTDSFGNVLFLLNAGNYYFWSAKDHYTFPNPDLEPVP